MIFSSEFPWNMNSKLQVMKFGGTSVGDASCIRRSATIVANASKQFPVAVVVSAMSGVTNRLIDAIAMPAERWPKPFALNISELFPLWFPASPRNHR